MGNQHSSTGRGPTEGGCVFMVRLSKREKADLQRRARDVGLSMSAYVRARLGLEDATADTIARISRGEI